MNDADGFWSNPSCDTLQPSITFDEVSHLEEAGSNRHKMNNACRIESNNK